MIKGFRQIVSLTALSRLFGLVRTICYTYYFGAGGLLDAWFIAFKIPNLSRRLFGEGAASASFIPVYSSQLHKDPKKAAQLANTVVTVIFVLLAAIVLLGWTVIWAYQTYFDTNADTKLILTFTSIMLPYMLMVCIVAILAGILNVHRHFAAPAAAPIILNIFIIATAVITGSLMNIQPKQQLFAIAFAVLAAGIVQIAIQIPPLKANHISIRPQWQIRSQAFKKILIMMAPMILGLTVTQINTLFDDLIAWWLSGSPQKGQFFYLFGKQILYPIHRGSVSYLNVAQRLYQFPLGVFGIALATAVFPVMSASAAKNDIKKLKSTIAVGLKAAIFIALPATIGLILVAKPLVAAVFQHGKFNTIDTNATAKTLLFYALGLTGFFIQQIVTRAFYATHDSKTPAKSALFAVILNIILNLTLIWPLATAGLACSTAVCSYLQVVILITILRRKHGPQILHGTIKTLIKTIIATALMAAVAAPILAIMKILPDTFRFHILRLAITVPAAAATYILAAKILKIEMLELFTSKKIEV